MVRKEGSKMGGERIRFRLRLVSSTRERDWVAGLREPRSKNNNNLGGGKKRGRGEERHPESAEGPFGRKNG